MTEESLNLSIQHIEQKHIPSVIQADTLFTFTTNIEYMIEWLSARMLFARYNQENIQYLRIKGRNSIAFPMKCFCDINLHRLKKHVNSYGCYGLAFSKEWGMRNGMQAVQYINPQSNLANDISEILNPIFNEQPDDTETEEMWKLKSYVLHQLMFCKPYSDNRQCFTDECEWRFVPSVPDDLPPIIMNEQDMSKNRLNLLNDIVKQYESLAIKFDISDVKYIIIEKEDDFDKIVSIVDAIGSDSFVTNRLLSKIIVWDTSKEDF